jgi:hypothetical protein
MTGVRTNREPTVRFQGGAWVGSGLREGNDCFQGSRLWVVLLFGAGLGSFVQGGLGSFTGGVVLR